MESLGIVRETIDDIIVVEFMRKSACGDSCESCSAKCAESKLEYLEFKNTISAKVGDIVKLNVNKKAIFNYKLLVYGLPMIFLMLGITISNLLLNKNQINNSDILSLIFGMLSMGCSYLIIKKIDNKFKYNSTNLMIIEKM